MTFPIGGSPFPEPNVLHIFSTHESRNVRTARRLWKSISVYLCCYHPQPRRMKVIPANHHQIAWEAAVHHLHRPVFSMLPHSHW